MNDYQFEKTTIWTMKECPRFPLNVLYIFSLKRSVVYLSQYDPLCWRQVVQRCYQNKTEWQPHHTQWIYEQQDIADIHNGLLFLRYIKTLRVSLTSSLELLFYFVKMNAAPGRNTYKYVDLVD